MNISIDLCPPADWLSIYLYLLIIYSPVTPSETIIRNFTEVANTKITKRAITDISTEENEMKYDDSDKQFQVYHLSQVE